MTKLRVDGVRFRLRRGSDPAAAEPLLRRALAQLAGGSAPNEKTGRRKALHRLRLAGPEPDYLLKVNRYGLLDGWRRRWAGSKARRELARAERAAALGVPTPLPLAAGERVSAGALRACYLLVPIVAGARDLRAVLEHDPPHGEARRALARAFGDLARRVHDAGIFQDDFAPNNFLLGPGGPADLRMIDFERARMAASVGARLRRGMLAKLSREIPSASASDRARFLAAYAGEGPAGWRRWWRSLEEETARLAQRDARRLLRVTTRPGRRFLPLAAKGMRGYRRADATGLRGYRRADATGLRGYRRADAAPLALVAAVEALERARPEPAGGALQVRAGAGHWALECPRLSRHEGRALWANAHLLARRGGLAARPDALVWRGERALLVFPGEAPVRLAAWARSGVDVRSRALPGLTVFFDRLLALGSLEPPPPGWLALDPEGRRAPQLLWPGGFRADGTPHADRHRRSRELALGALGLGV